MSEILWNRYEWQENRNSENISVFDSVKHQNKLQGFYMRNKDNPQTIHTLKDFVDKQEQDKKDKLNIKENLEKSVLQETREWLDKQAMINEAKTMLYEKLWIDDNQNNNSSFENFEKWIIDELILNNYDLAIQVWETNWEIILDSISQLASLEWLKQIAEAIWESFWNLLTWNAYEKWKAVAELWLIWTWVWAWVYVWKKTLKLWMKQISKLRINKERLVQSPEIKNVIWETNNKVAEIVPKKEFDFEKAVVEDIAKLWDKDRIDAWKFYLNRDLSPKQQDAIIKAHNVWKDREWSWIYSYNQAEITEKARILKEAWFSKEERKVLLEKWVCGKEYSNKLADNLPEDRVKELIELRDKLEKERKIDINRQVKWLEELWIPESFSRDMLESWILKKEFFWWDLLRRFKALENNKIYINDKIDKVIESIPKLTREEALLIFSYTDDVIFGDLNNYMRWILNRDLTETNINAINNIITKLESWLNKMPDLKPWKEWFILRWDKWEGWKKEVWEEIDLEAFTSVANNKRDAFIWDEFDTNIEISIIWKQWRIKDVSSLSIAVNYWVTKVEKEILTDFSGKLKKLPKTTNEWIVLPNSKVKVLYKHQWEDIYYTIVRQTK